MERRIFLKLAGLAAAGNMALKYLILPEELWAKEIYPTRKITWIVPAKPGGGMDTTARFLSLPLTAAFKELVPSAKGGEIIIKNIPEAGGRKAYSYLTNAKPDGYTIGDLNLGFIAESMISNPAFEVSKLSFLVRPGVSIRVIATRKGGFKNWKEMMAAGKINEIKWAASNFGSTGHIESILVKEAMGIPAKLINTGGAPESVASIIRGDTHVGLFTMEAIQVLVKAEELRLLLVFADKSDYSGVSTSTELGYPDLTANIRHQRFIVGPPEMSSDVLGVIIAAFKKTLTKKDVIEWADKVEFPILPLYGKEAEKAAKGVINFYIKMMPTLRKYLQ